MERLFSVYKIHNGDRILLGGMVDRRRKSRSGSDTSGLIEIAKRKFAESPDQPLTIVIEEES